MASTARYDILTWEEGGERYVAILSDDDDILESADAMRAIDAAICAAWGPDVETVGRGSDYFDQNGQEVGWCWTVQEAGEEL